MPGLVLGTGMALPSAIGTSLFAVTAFGLTAAGSYAASGLVDWPIALLVVAGGTAGILIGAKVNSKIEGRKRALSIVFAAVVITVGVYIVAQGLPTLLAHV